MPRYQWSVTTPSQTARQDRVRQTITVDELVLVAGNRFAPPGADGEVKARILFGARSLLPVEAGSPAVLPERSDMVDLNFQLPGVPNQVRLEAWAPDADFQHTVTATVDTTTPENVPAEVVLTDVAPSVGTGEPVETDRPPEL